MKIDTSENGHGIVLEDVFNGIGIKTDQGMFGIAQRDGGIEVMLDGKFVWGSVDALAWVDPGPKPKSHPHGQLAYPAEDPPSHEDRIASLERFVKVFKEQGIPGPDVRSPGVMSGSRLTGGAPLNDQS